MQILVLMTTEKLEKGLLAGLALKNIEQRPITGVVPGIEVYRAASTGIVPGIEEYKAPTTASAPGIEEYSVQ